MTVPLRVTIIIFSTSVFLVMWHPYTGVLLLKEKATLPDSVSNATTSHPMVTTAEDAEPFCSESAPAIMGSHLVYMITSEMNGVEWPS